MNSFDVGANKSKRNMEPNELRDMRILRTVSDLGGPVVGRDVQVAMTRCDSCGELLTDMANGEPWGKLMPEEREVWCWQCASEWRFSRETQR